MRLCIIRVQLQGGAVVFNGLVNHALGLVDNTEIAMGFCEIRIECQYNMVQLYRIV
jgi:hypothetical protein